MTRKIFPLSSRLIFSPELINTIPESELMIAFARHDSGDWGIVSSAVGKQNRFSLRRGGTDLVSEFEAKNGMRFRVVTSSDSRFTRFEKA